VLDQLNAWLKPHGPLVSSRRLDLGANARWAAWRANNSCGSRSIRYGNMVHNVAAIDTILADGKRARFAAKRPEDMQPAVRAIAEQGGGARRRRAGRDRAHVPQGAAAGRRL